MLGGLVYTYRIAFRAAGFPGDTAQSNAFLFLPPPQRRECGGSEAQGDLDHADGEIEDALLGSMDDGVAVGLPEAGAAVVVPGAAVDGSAAVGGADDLDGIGDVLHNNFSFSCCVLLCWVVWFTSTG